VTDHEDETMRRLTIATLAILLLPVFAPGTEAQDETDTQRLSVPLTNPGRPVTLDVSLLSGGISIEGYEGSEVEILISAGPSHQRGSRSNGMRAIPNSGLGLTVDEEDNHVRIHSRVMGRAQELRLKVPHRTSLKLKTINNGDITVTDIEGEVELQNTNGSITATGIRGWAVANTTNGEVKVTFDGIQSDKPMSFVTFNGTVDVTFPESLKADLRMKADNGEIFTDFDFRLLETEPQVQREREGDRFRVRLDQEVRATIGGGGQEIYFKTWRGNIYIRKPGAQTRGRDL